MFRVGLIVTVITILVGCTTVSDQNSPSTEVATKNPIQQPTATLAENESTPENPAQPEKQQIQEYPVPAGTSSPRRRAGSRWVSLVHRATGGRVGQA